MKTKLVDIVDNLLWEQVFSFPKYLSKQSYSGFIINFRTFNQVLFITSAPIRSCLAEFCQCFAK